MKNNIFSPNWHYKKYYLGYILNSDTSMDLYFYSHEQRYIVKIREQKGFITTTIDTVDAFDRKVSRLDQIYLNADYQKPSGLTEMYCDEFTEEFLEKVSKRESYIVDMISDVSHANDIILYDGNANMIIPFHVSNIEDYMEDGIEKIITGDEFGAERNELTKKLETMICQLQGKPVEEILTYKIYDVFMDKKVILLGVSYLKNFDARYPQYISLYFSVNDILYSFTSGFDAMFRGKHWSLEEVKNIEQLPYYEYSNKAEFYFYGKEVNVSEYNMKKQNKKLYDKFWEMGNLTQDLRIPKSISYGFVSSFFASDDLFAVSLDDKHKFTARILISKMEQIKGSSYSVKCKRFLEKVEDFLEVKDK